MFYSMTGFAFTEATYDNISCTIEVRSVNHRFLNLSAKVPKDYSCFENDCVKIAKSMISRGKVDIYIQIKNNNDEYILILNPSICSQLEEKRKEASQLVGYEIPKLTMNELRQIQNALITTPAKVDLQQHKEFLLSTVTSTLEKMRTMQQKEGLLLEKTITKNCETISYLKNQIAAQQQLAQEKSKSKLEERLWTILGKTNLDQSRLYQEIGYLLEHSDIQEELDRLSAHMDHIKDIFKEQKPVGRKLDFLCQELAREANTICSKANFMPISQIAIELKCEIEKLREQIQNIE